MKIQLRWRILVLSVLFTGQPVNAAEGETYHGNPIEISLWMAEAMNTFDRSAKGALHLFRFKEPVYVLLEPISWKPDDPKSDIAPVTVPKGFVTDLTSVPRAFWSFFRPDGEYTYPAIVHDYLYWQQDRERSEADEVFRLMMKEFDVDSATKIYGAVRLGGKISWKNNLNLKLSGERRLLRRLPQDPKMTWAKWKTKKRVFFE